MSLKREEEIKSAVRDFVLRSIHVSTLSDDDDLFQSGLVNSLFAVQLMTFIERTFSIDVEVEDLDVENFKSLNATAAFVQRKAGAPTARGHGHP